MNRRFALPCVLLCFAPAAAFAGDPAPPAPAPEPESILERFDEDGDGQLDREETARFQRWLTGEFDQDGDGRLSREERETARRHLREREREQRERRERELRERYDEDHDGRLDARETERMRREEAERERRIRREREERAKKRRRDREEGERDRPERDRPERDRPEADRPERDRPEADRPERDRPERDRPERDRPERDRPDATAPRAEPTHIRNAAGAATGVAPVAFFIHAQPVADQTERQSSSRRLAASGTRLPRTGEQVGQYTIQQELGRGTMGAVYRASDPAGREVALKLLTPENQDPVGLLRFQREGRILAALPAHQNVLRIHAMGVHGTLPWLALDLIEGQSLEDRLAAGSLSLRESVALVRTLCLAVDHVHRAGVLHRDLKAANVLLRKEDGEPVLTDFGLALLEGTEGLTRTGDLLGTPLYMAPEQVLGIRKEIDAQTDVWSLGVILYRAVTGGYPFQAGNLSELARMVNHDEWTPLVTRLGRDDPALSLVIGRALAKRKLARYRSARDMAADLAAWPGMPTSRAPEAAAWVRRATVLLGLLAGVLGVTLVAVLLARPLPAPPATAGALPRFDLSGADDGPSRLALEQLRRATRDPGDAAGQLLLAAEADRLARVPDLPGAAAIVSQLAAGPTRDLLAARLALLGGTPPNEGALVLLLDSQDDPTAAAARVLLARACRVADPARAVSLLASRVPPATRVAEEEVARALLAADQLDPRLLVETPPRLRAEVGARLRFALGRALDEGAAGLPRVEALLRSHAALGLRPVADPLADRVLDLLLPAPGPKVGLSLPISTSTRVWVDLGASGLRPTWRRRAEHCLDLLVFAMETGFDHALAVLTAAVQLDVDVTVTHLHLLTQLSMGRTASFGDGWVGEYLSLVDDTEAEGKVRKEQDQIQAEARAKLLAGLRAGRFELGPVNRARALVQSVHVQMPPETAIAVMQEALALDPGNPWATIQLAQALTVHGEKAEGARLALLGARRMEELHGDRPGISWQRAIMLRGAIDLLCNIDRVEEARALLPLIEAMEVPDSHRRAREDVEDAEARLGLRPPRPR